MPDAQPPPLPPQARAGYHQRRMWGKVGAFLLMLVPIPVAFLLMTMNEAVGEQLYGYLNSSKPGFSSAVALILLALLCCVAGAIKVLDGFEKGGWRIFAGIVLGLLFLLFDWFAVFLAACAAGSSH